MKFEIKYDFGSSATVTVDADSEDEAIQAGQEEGERIAADWLTLRSVVYVREIAP